MYISYQRISKESSYLQDLPNLRDLLCSRQWLVCEEDSFCEELTFDPKDKLTIDRYGVITQTRWYLNANSRIRIKRVGIKSYIYPFFWDGTLLVFKKSQVQGYIFLIDADQADKFSPDVMKDFDAFFKKWKRIKAVKLSYQSISDDAPNAIILEDPLEDLWKVMETTWSIKEKRVRKEERGQRWLSERAIRTEEREEWRKQKKQLIAESQEKETALKKEVADLRSQLLLQTKMVELKQVVVDIDSSLQQKTDLLQNITGQKELSFDQKAQQEDRERQEQVLNKLMELEQLTKQVISSQPSGDKVVANGITEVWSRYHKNKKSTLKNWLRSELEKNREYMWFKEYCIYAFISLLVFLTFGIIALFLPDDRNFMGDNLFFSCFFLELASLFFFLFFLIQTLPIRQTCYRKLKKRYEAEYLSKILTLVATGKSKKE